MLMQSLRKPLICIILLNNMLPSIKLKIATVIKNSHYIYGDNKYFGNVALTAVVINKSCLVFGTQ